MGRQIYKYIYIGGIDTPSLEVINIENPISIHDNVEFMLVYWNL